ncbi:MAG: hypothetical protein ACT4P5_10130, partial [Armatimonadota bacterium]
VMSLRGDITFGHPHPTPLDTRAGANDTINRTDLDGAVALRRDGTTWRAATARARGGAKVRDGARVH